MAFQCPHASPQTILIVDDETRVLHFMSRAIERLGHNVATAKNGREAIERLKISASIALVLSDLDMPEMNGVELYNVMRANECWRGIPFAIITGGLGQGMPRGLIALRKPCDIMQLRCAIAAHLGGSCPMKRTCEGGAAGCLRAHLPLVAGETPYYCQDHCAHCPKLFYT